MNIEICCCLPRHSEMFAGFFFVQCDVIWPNSNEFRTLSFMDFDPEFCEDLPLILAKKLRILPYTTKSGPKNLHFQPKYPEFWSKYPEFCQNPEFFSTLSFIRFAQRKSLRYYLIRSEKKNVQRFNNCCLFVYLFEVCSWRRQQKSQGLAFQMFGEGISIKLIVSHFVFN